LCLLKAFPLRDRYALWRRRSIHNSNLAAASIEIVTACGLLRLGNAHRDISSELGVKGLKFANGVGFLSRSLSVQPLHGRRATHPTENCQCDCVFRLHSCSPKNDYKLGHSPNVGRITLRGCEMELFVPLGLGLRLFIAAVYRSS